LKNNPVDQVLGGFFTTQYNHLFFPPSYFIKMKQILLGTEDMTSDVMEVRVRGNKVIFDVMVDHCGTQFSMGKDDLKKLLG